MKALVLGASGMLGHRIFLEMRAHYEGVAGTTRSDPRLPPYQAVNFLHGTDIHSIDATSTGAVRDLIARLRPEFVINCIGVIKQRQAAHEAIPCIAVNALLPHQLADLSRDAGARLIHFSTDCVFDGRRGRYTEDDAANAEDLYGRTKALGEVTGPNALTLRTSIIGRELANFGSLLEWFLAQRGKTIRGFTRVIYSGVTTNYLAGTVRRIIEEQPGLNGLYQVASEPIAKHDLLLMLRDAFTLQVEILPDDGPVLDRSMIGERFEDVTGYRTPSWSQLVSQLAADPAPYEQWRS